MNNEKHVTQIMNVIQDPIMRFELCGHITITMMDCLCVNLDIRLKYVQK